MTSMMMQWQLLQRKQVFYNMYYYINIYIMYYIYFILLSFTTLTNARSLFSCFLFRALTSVIRLDSMVELGASSFCVTIPIWRSYKRLLHFGTSALGALELQHKRNATHTEDATRGVATRDGRTNSFALLVQPFLIRNHLGNNFS